MSPIVKNLQEAALDEICTECGQNLYYHSGFHHVDSASTCSCSKPGISRYNLQKLRSFLVHVRRPKLYIDNLLHVFNVWSEISAQEFIADLRLQKPNLHDYKLFRELGAQPNDDYIYPVAVEYYGVDLTVKT